VLHLSPLFTSDSVAEVGSKSRWVKIRLYKKQRRFHNNQGGQTVKIELINQYLLQLYTHIKLNFIIDVGQLTTLFVHCLRHSFETVTRFTQRTPPSPDLQSSSSTDVVRLGIKPCRRHHAPDPAKR
ncbi:unnamed protein product, partial [Brassica oleracea]